MFRDALARFEEALKGDFSVEKKLDDACEAMKRCIPHYDRVNVYKVSDGNEGGRIYNSYKGEQAGEENSLPSDTGTNSKTTISIRKGDRIVGALDVGSGRHGDAGPEEKEFLSEICRRLAEELDKK